MKLGFALLLLSVSICSAQSRGKYLVERAAMCVDCHTPMLASGQPDATKYLKGATLGFQPLHPVPKWSATAPDLTPTGLLWKKWGETGIQKFLETGLGPGGHPADPPMPPYKFTPEDAAAIVAYLKGLK